MTDTQLSKGSAKRGPKHHIDLGVDDEMKSALRRAVFERSEASGRRVTQMEIIREAIRKELGLPT